MTGSVEDARDGLIFQTKSMIIDEVHIALLKNRRVRLPVQVLEVYISTEYIHVM